MIDNGGDTRDDIFRRFAGLWIALQNGVVVESRLNAHALHLALHERDITGVTILRCPDRDEPELVGLG